MNTDFKRVPAAAICGRRKTAHRASFPNVLAFFGSAAALLVQNNALPDEPPSAPSETIRIVVVKTSEAADPVLVNNVRNHVQRAGYAVWVHDETLEQPQQVNEDADFAVAGSFRPVDTGFELTVYSLLPLPAIVRPAVIDVPDASERAIRGAVTELRQFLESQAVQFELVKSRYEKATAVLADNPRDFESLMTAGLYAYFYQDWEEAIETLETAAAAAPPSDPSAYYALARCYSSMGNPGKTLRYLEKTLNIEPTHEGARLELGNLNYFQGDVDNAISQYRELLVRPDGRNAKRASWNLGLAYMGKEAWDDARKQFESLTASAAFGASAQGMIQRIDEITAAIAEEARERRQRRQIFVGSLIGLFAAALAGLIGVIVWWAAKKKHAPEGPRTKLIGYVLSGLFGLLNMVVGVGIGAMMSQALQ